MAPGKIIITVEGVDAKLLNRLLLHLRDWEFGQEGSWDSFYILRTIEDSSGENSGQVEDTPPLHEFLANEWEGLSFEQVQELLLQKDDEHGSMNLFLLLDNQGVQDGTIICAQQAMNPDPDVDSEEFYLPEYEKVRVPWQEVYSMWCNLNIANMDFEDFCDSDKGHDENHWWIYKPIEPEDHYFDFATRRDAIIKELEEQGLA